MKLTVFATLNNEERRTLAEIETQGLQMVQNYVLGDDEKLAPRGSSIRKDEADLDPGQLQRALAMRRLHSICAGPMTNPSETQDESYGPAIALEQLMDLREWIHRAVVVCRRESKVEYWEAIPDGELTARDREIVNVLIEARTTFLTKLYRANEIIEHAIAAIVMHPDAPNWVGSRA